MKYAIPLFWAILACPRMALSDSMLWMQWQGLGPDARAVSLAPGDTAIIEVYFRRDPQGFDLRHLAFKNEPAVELEQVATAVLRGGWEDRSMDGMLGDASQTVDFRQFGNCGVAGCPPPVFDLYGTQTLRLDGLGDGNPLEITFDLASIQIIDFSGLPYRYQASSSPFLEDTNTYHIGAGSPGYIDVNEYEDERDPLIVIPVPEPSSLLLLSFATAIIFRRCGHPLRR